METGQKLKALNFLLDDNKIISCDDLFGKKLIIYFYPKDDTPGCTKEAQDFNSLNKKFNKLNVRIIGISKDSIEKHVKFKKKYNLSINLVSDEDLKICKAFKVWIEKSMYGRKYMGIERSTFLFDEKLVLIKTWRNVKVKNHAQEVLDFIS
tara:strand:+ start:177 stop:629 length:453 start_codon:yes stop_codon:yes gene_type:complete